MANPLLDRGLPAELAERNQVIEYEGEIGEFERLVRIIEADLAALPEAEHPRAWRRAPVQIRLEFRWVDARRDLPAVEGRVAAQLTAVCQRCLEAFGMPLEVGFSMLLLKPTDGTAEMANTAAYAEFEIWEMDEERLRPRDLIEEALIMALPLAPKHGLGDCRSPLADDAPEEQRAEMARPFADLKAQMEKMNK